MPHPTCALGEPRISVGNAGDTVLIIIEMRSSRRLTADELDAVKSAMVKAVESLCVEVGL